MREVELLDFNGEETHSKGSIHIDETKIFYNQYLFSYIDGNGSNILRIPVITVLDVSNLTKRQLMMLKRNKQQ